MSYAILQHLFPSNVIKQFLLVYDIKSKNILRSCNINSIPYEITSLAVHLPIQKHMYISTPLHEEAIIHSLVSWMKCIIVLVIWGACKNNLENLVFGYIFHTHCADG